ncbi:glycosyltransferase family 4 protein [Opitutales bacterium ASA1]|uniref:glycosyltransferase n=1 Tax=Congregicoccus parvus TaxID=3081749 RepID=UPI002B2EED03|nr:glycosyltransferase family 4 protein [Opitutales bacterium ASA1]
MHVGYVLKKFPRLSETFVLNEILELQRQGVEVTVFSLQRPDDGVFHAALAELRHPVVYLSGHKPEVWLQRLREHRDRLRLSVSGIWSQVDDMLEAGRPDLWTVLGWGFELAVRSRAAGISHLHAHFATVAAYVARTAHAIGGVPYSVTCHAKDIYRDGIVPAHFRSLLAPAAFVATVCEANRRWIQERLDDVSSIDLRVLYNGVDTMRFHPAHRNRPVTPALLAVGRLVEKKGFFVLLDALDVLARQGRRPVCRIVGEGEDGERLRARARALDLDHVEFLGMRTHDEVRSLMGESTLMVLPCIVGADGNRDALPTVLLEALASGLPVVSTPVGGIEEIVEHGRTGILVPCGDAEALARALAATLDDPETAETRARHGRLAAEEKFSLHTNVATLSGWFEAGKRTEEAVEVVA